MCMAALTRSGSDTNWIIILSRKIDIWPFIKIVKTKRSSNNGPCGMNELKSVVSMRKKDVRDMIIEKILNTVVEI